MKTRFMNVSIILLGLAMIFTSCKKEDVSDDSKTTQDQAVKSYVLDNIPLIPNEQDINVLMKNDKDKDEEKLNYYLYELGIATKELIKDATFNKTIIKMAQESSTQTAYLLDLKETAPKYYRAINTKLAEKNLSLESIEKDMTHAPILPNPKYPETAEIEKYVPAIFIPNLGIIDADKQPVISPNIETDCSNNSDIEDYIIAWYYSQDGSLNEIILGEETSLQTSNPLFLLDHASPKGYLPTIRRDEVERPEHDIQDRGFNDIEEFRAKQIGIKSGYGYETGARNKSEFAVVATYSSSGYPSNFVFSANNDHSITYKKFLPSTHNINSYFSPNYVPIHGLSGFKVFWNTFERDWNRQPKTLGYALNVLDEPGTNDDTYLSGRRRYEGDWYTWIPSTLPSHPLPIGWYQWLTEINFDNWKSNINIRSQE